MIDLLHLFDLASMALLGVEPAVPPLRLDAASVVVGLALLLAALATLRAR